MLSTLLVNRRVPAMSRLPKMVLVVAAVNQRLPTSAHTLPAAMNTLALNVPRPLRNAVVPKLVVTPLTTSEPPLTVSAALLVMRSVAMLVA